MENKYYIPEIEEFHIGFEYESYCNNEWDNEVVDNDTYGGNISGGYFWDYVEHPLIKKEIRVKYLDRNDIESLSFEKSKKDQWVGWHDYVLKEINPEYGYYLYCTLHVPRVETWGGQKMMYKILLHRHYDDEQSNIDYWLHKSEAEQVYNGMIKNKSELKRLMKQLNITNL